jgi:hypothetical protein
VNGLNHIPEHQNAFPICRTEKMAGFRGDHVAFADHERSFAGMAAMIEESITINASIKKVWGMFIDLTCWREWNTVLTVVPPFEQGPIAEGESFTCVIRPLAFAVYLRPLASEVLPCKRVVLSGNKFGIRARHEFLFDGNEEHASVSSRETFTGVPPVLPGWVFVQRKIQKLTRTMLQDLKNAAESMN